jgi:membrane protease YdiL (CAAX protease family)
MSNQKHLTIKKIILSLLFFTGLWAAVTDAWESSLFLFGSDRTQYQKFAYDIVCRIVWVLPLPFLFRHYAADLPLNLKSLISNKINLKLLIIFIVLFTLYALCVMFTCFGRFRINPEFSILRDTIFYITVGLVEEFVYRGWAQNAFSVFMSKKRANITATFFFVVLHWSAYIIRYFTTGTFQMTQLLMQSAVVFILSLLFGYAFRKNKSILTPVLLHAYFDWIVALLGA